MSDTQFYGWNGSYPLPLPPNPEHGADVPGIRQEDILEFLEHDFRQPHMRGIWAVGSSYPSFYGSDGEGWFSVMKFASFELSVRPELRSEYHTFAFVLPLFSLCDQWLTKPHAVF